MSFFHVQSSVMYENLVCFVIQSLFFHNPTVFFEQNFIWFYKLKLHIKELNGISIRLIRNRQTIG